MLRLRYTLFFASLLALPACNDQLDFYPHSSVSPDNTSEKDMDALLYGMYNSVQNSPGRESYIFYDLIGGELMNPSGGNQLAFINNFLRPEYSLIGNAWDGYYRALYQVNNVLATIAPFTDTQKKREMAGTAHFFRAYLYYNLVTRWGGVPVLEQNTNEKVSRNSEEEVWNFIERELEAALPDAPAYVVNRYYYVNKDAVQALMARVKLARGKKQEAAALAEGLITSGRYKLDTFEKIFRKQQNTEVIFAFENLTEESSITLSTLFYTYSHTVKGSYVYKPTDDVMQNLFEANDKRKPISIDVVQGLNVINKYPSGQSGTDPFIVTRLAEMYLISAEAQGMAGLNRLNELRQARGLVALSPSSEESYLDAVLLERRRELLAEGFRWYDLVRTGKAVSTLGIEPHRQKLPLPESEIILNDQLEQNPNY
ncbi:RagB/SusD family nutrient uptake outer membrane protein [Rufibacter immobilis]|uniref:RagB/SusD family nutrient uptake outer membrane protein n=1 Tax=Rufibacter immobilis TaxID=1348778 RepID=A0A3M9MYZ8_9BACT|nr:RagB/SusD family nutrient uptake outer membrane protein [Rufibacter immobilis]RNI29988.1 RagB/SusD family nutrient uptake outer membrane protein [Rufibacter immobilis]